MLHEVFKLCMKEEQLEKLSKSLLHDMEEKSEHYLELTAEENVMMIVSGGSDIVTKMVVSNGAKEHLTKVVDLVREL